MTGRTEVYTFDRGGRLVKADERTRHQVEQLVLGAEHVLFEKKTTAPLFSAVILGTSRPACIVIGFDNLIAGAELQPPCGNQEVIRTGETELPYVMFTLPGRDKSLTPSLNGMVINSTAAITFAPRHSDLPRGWETVEAHLFAVDLNNVPLRDAFTMGRVAAMVAVAGVNPSGFRPDFWGPCIGLLFVNQRNRPL